MSTTALTDRHECEKPPLQVHDVVTVSSRTWPGINRPGGVGRVVDAYRKTGTDSKHFYFAYDVKYMLGGFDNDVEDRYVSNNLDNSTESCSKQRNVLGRCRMCRCLIIDCGHNTQFIDYPEHEEDDGNMMLATVNTVKRPHESLSSNASQRKAQSEYNSSHVVQGRQRRRHKRSNSMMDYLADFPLDNTDCRLSTEAPVSLVPYGDKQQSTGAGTTTTAGTDRTYRQESEDNRDDSASTVLPAAAAAACSDHQEQSRDDGSHERDYRESSEKQQRRSRTDVQTDLYQYHEATKSSDTRVKVMHERNGNEIRCKGTTAVSLRSQQSIKTHYHRGPLVTSHRPRPRGAGGCSTRKSLSFDWSSLSDQEIFLSTPTSFRIHKKASARFDIHFSLINSSSSSGGGGGGGVVIFCGRFNSSQEANDACARLRHSLRVEGIMRLAGGVGGGGGESQSSVHIHSSQPTTTSGGSCSTCFSFPDQRSKSVAGSTRSSSTSRSTASRSSSSGMLRILGGSMGCGRGGGHGNRRASTGTVDTKGTAGTKDTDQKAEYHSTTDRYGTAISVLTADATATGGSGNGSGACDASVFFKRDPGEEGDGSIMRRRRRESEPHSTNGSADRRKSICSLQSIIPPPPPPPPPPPSMQSILLRGL